MTAGNWARRLCNFAHPKFIAELKRALQAERIPFNNANFSSGDIISGRYYVPNFEILVLNEDFERATKVLSKVLQHWEFEPSAGFSIGEGLPTDYRPARATENGWLREDLSALAWSGPNLQSADTIGLALRENEIPYRMDLAQLGTAKIFIHPEDEAIAKQVVREALEGVPSE